MSIQEFEKLQAEIPTPELIEKARVWIELMNKICIAPCSGNHKSVNDPDMVFGEVCRRLEYMEHRCVAAEAYIEESPCDPDITQAQWAAYRFWEGVKSVTP